VDEGAFTLSKPAAYSPAAGRLTPQLEPSRLARTYTVFSTATSTRVRAT